MTIERKTQYGFGSVSFTTTRELKPGKIVVLRSDSGLSPILSGTETVTVDSEQRITRRLSGTMGGGSSTQLSGPEINKANVRSTGVLDFLRLKRTEIVYRKGSKQ
jgi:hypothetical protein